MWNSDNNNKKEVLGELKFFNLFGFYQYADEERHTAGLRILSLNGCGFSGYSRVIILNGSGEFQGNRDYLADFLENFEI